MQSDKDRQTQITTLPGDEITWDRVIRWYKLETCHDWEKADFRYDTGKIWPDGRPIKPAVIVVVTEKKMYPYGPYQRVRCKIIWRGDGEPDKHANGWLLLVADR